MKRKLLLLLCAIFTFQHFTAQVTDTVSFGNGYANQVLCSLANDNQGTAPKSNRKLVFHVSGPRCVSMLQQATPHNILQKIAPAGFIRYSRDHKIQQTLEHGYTMNQSCGSKHHQYLDKKTKKFRNLPAVCTYY